MESRAVKAHNAAHHDGLPGLSLRGLGPRRVPTGAVTLNAVWQHRMESALSGRWQCRLRLTAGHLQSANDETITVGPLMANPPPAGPLTAQQVEHCEFSSPRFIVFHRRRSLA
eukprot:SAG11_NODE_1618_length_4571_cov_11.714733_1_plen_113_part_00